MHDDAHAPNPLAAGRSGAPACAAAPRHRRLASDTPAAAPVDTPVAESAVHEPASTAPAEEDAPAATDAEARTQRPRHPPKHPPKHPLTHPLRRRLRRPAQASAPAPAEPSAAQVVAQTAAAMPSAFRRYSAAPPSR
jgi:hypothetical protein